MSDHGLISAVLLQAVTDAIRPPARGKNRRNNREVENNRIDAMRWLHARTLEPWSAAWCASIVGCDIDEIRYLIRARPASIYREIMASRNNQYTGGSKDDGD